MVSLPPRSFSFQTQRQNFTLNLKFYHLDFQDRFGILLEQIANGDEHSQIEGIWEIRNKQGVGKSCNCSYGGRSCGWIACL